jgi:hypothetical protein
MNFDMCVAALMSLSCQQFNDQNAPAPSACDGVL